jgi:hypothetical protein
MPTKGYKTRKNKRTDKMIVALPNDLRLCSEFDTSPITALQSANTLRISPERNLRVTCAPSFATPTKGYKTRKNKRTDKMIVRRRNKR